MEIDQMMLINIIQLKNNNISKVAIDILSFLNPKQLNTYQCSILKSLIDVKDENSFKNISIDHETLSNDEFLSNDLISSIFLSIISSNMNKGLNRSNLDQQQWIKIFLQFPKEMIIKAIEVYSQNHNNFDLGNKFYLRNCLNYLLLFFEIIEFSSPNLALNSLEFLLNAWKLLFESDSSKFVNITKEYGQITIQVILFANEIFVKQFIFFRSFAKLSKFLKEMMVLFRQLLKL